MTRDDALKAGVLALAKTNAQQHLLAVLIKTHPDPVRLVAALEDAGLRLEALHLNDPLVPDQVRESVQADMNDFLVLARQAASRADRAG